MVGHRSYAYYYTPIKSYWIALNPFKSHELPLNLAGSPGLHHQLPRKTTPHPTFELSWTGTWVTVVDTLEDSTNQPGRVNRD